MRGRSLPKFASHAVPQSQTAGTVRQLHHGNVAQLACNRSRGRRSRTITQLLHNEYTRSPIGGQRRHSIYNTTDTQLHCARTTRLCIDGVRCDATVDSALTHQPIEDRRRQQSTTSIHRTVQPASGASGRLAGRECCLTSVFGPYGQDDEYGSRRDEPDGAVPQPGDAHARRRSRCGCSTAVGA